MQIAVAYVLWQEVLLIKHWSVLAGGEQFEEIPGFVKGVSPKFLFLSHFMLL